MRANRRRIPAIQDSAAIIGQAMYEDISARSVGGDRLERGPLLGPLAEGDESGAVGLRRAQSSGDRATTCHEIGHHATPEASCRCATPTVELSVLSATRSRLGEIRQEALASLFERFVLADV
jgi:hypothetical protein